jgi:hypothetical protein
LRLGRNTIIAVTVAIISFLYGCAYAVFPLAGGDSIVFLVPALSFAQSGKLINALYYVGRLTDAGHTGLFNYYVPVFPMLVGWLARWSPTVVGCFMASATFGGISLGLLATHCTLEVGRSSNRRAIPLAIAVIVYSATYLLPIQGRPEILSGLWIALLYLAYQNRERFGRPFFEALLVTLLALELTTQITSSIFSFLLVVIDESTGFESVTTSIKKNAARLLAVLCLATVVLFVSPVGIQATLTGIALHLKIVLQRTDRSAFLYGYYWVLSPINFGFAVIVLAAGGIYLNKFSGRWATLERAKRVFVIFMFAALTFCIVKFVCYTAPTVYNATQFIIPLSAYLFTAIVRRQSPMAVRSTWPVAAVWAWGCVILARTCLLGLDYRADGRDYRHMAPKFDSVVAQYPGCYVTSGLWALSSNPSQLKIHHNDGLKAGDVIVVQNAYEWLKPTEMQHWRLLYDCRVPHSKMVLGMPYRHPQGYTFAVYEVR